MGYFANDAEGESVGDVVLHDDTAVVFCEVVAVVPEFVGTDSLVVDEGALVIDVGDFGEPGDPDEWRKFDFVADDLALVHRLGITVSDFEAYGVGGEFIEVPGC